MKKIFTLLFAVGMFTLAQAQTGTRDNRQYDQRNDQQYDQRNDQQYDQRNDQQYDQRNPGQNDQRGFNGGYDNGKLMIDANFSFGNDRGYGNNRFFNERKRDMQIARVNQYFDYKIQRIRRSFYMDWYEKKSLIRSLEQQRQWEIRMVYAKFSNRNWYDDRHDHHDPNDHPGRQY